MKLRSSCLPSAALDETTPNANEAKQLFSIGVADPSIRSVQSCGYVNDLEIGAPDFDRRYDAWFPVGVRDLLIGPSFHGFFPWAGLPAMGIPLMMNALTPPGSLDTINVLRRSVLVSRWPKVQFPTVFRAPVSRVRPAFTSSDALAAPCGICRLSQYDMLFLQDAL
jgi:hypothetical protein